MKVLNSAVKCQKTEKEEEKEDLPLKSPDKKDIFIIHLNKGFTVFLNSGFSRLEYFYLYITTVVNTLEKGTKINCSVSWK